MWARARTASSEMLQQLGDLRVRALAREDELDDGALIGGKGVERHCGVLRVVCRPWLKQQFPLQIVGFDALYGLEILSLGEEEATARVTVTDDVKQPAGLVHGGVYASIAESLTSFATWKAVSQDGMSAQGLSNQTSFLRPILRGHDPRHRPPPPPRPHDVGVGGRHHRRRGPPVRARPDDRRGASAVAVPGTRLTNTDHRGAAHGTADPGRARGRRPQGRRDPAGERGAVERDEAKKAAAEALEALATAAKATAKAATHGGKAVAQRAKARKAES